MILQCNVIHYILNQGNMQVNQGRFQQLNQRICKEVSFQKKKKRRIIKIPPEDRNIRKVRFPRQGDCWVERRSPKFSVPLPGNKYYAWVATRKVRNIALIFLEKIQKANRFHGGLRHLPSYVRTPDLEVVVAAGRWKCKRCRFARKRQIVQGCY